VQADEYDVALGPIDVLQDAEHLDLHGLGVGALKNGVRHAAHAGMDLLQRQDAGISRGRGWRIVAREQRNRSQQGGQ
jgi:hypothetical protein